MHVPLWWSLDLLKVSASLSGCRVYKRTRLGLHCFIHNSPNDLVQHVRCDVIRIFCFLHHNRPSQSAFHVTSSLSTWDVSWRTAPTLARPSGPSQAFILWWKVADHLWQIVGGFRRGGWPLKTPAVLNQGSQKYKGCNVIMHARNSNQKYLDTSLKY